MKQTSLLAGLVICVLLAGCASTPGTSEAGPEPQPTTPTTTTPTTTTTPPVTAAPTTSTIRAVDPPEVDFGPMLRAIPLEGLYRMSLSDSRRARFDLGIALPETQSPDTARDYAIGLARSPAEQPPGASLWIFSMLPSDEIYEIDDWNTAFGFDIFDVEAAALAFFESEGADPLDGALWVGSLTTPPNDIIAAIERDPVWSPLLEEMEHAGLPYFRWEREWYLEGRSAARPFGVGGQLALIEGGIVLHTTNEAIMQAALAATARVAPSVSDAGPLESAFAALESRGATSVELAFPPIFEFTLDAALDEPEPEVQLHPYLLAFAAHNAQQDFVALVHETSADATLNEQALTRLVESLEPWTTELVLEEVDTDGQVLTATFSRDDSVVIQALGARDTLFMMDPEL